MIRTLTAHTSELDDVNVAVSEILEQLDLDKNLLKNSAGAISCYSEFIDAGIVAALTEKLPFDVIGATTLGVTVPGGVGQLMLSVTVFTSDDIIFSCAVSEPLKHEAYKQQLNEAYLKAASALPGKPSMMFVFAPLTFNVAGDYMVKTLDEISAGIPIFGTLAVDHTQDYSTARTIFNGKTYPDALSMMLIYGDVEPVFSIASVSDEKILGQKAIITEAEDNVLKGVNGMSVIDYLQSIGLAPNRQIEGLNAIPFIIDFNDGTKPATRAIFAITPEGNAVCGGVMPVNATLGIGSLDHDEVLATTKKASEEILARQKKNGAFIFSCIVRNLILGFDVLAEMDVVQNTMNGKIPFAMSYSGGEICPVYNEEGKLVNRFHNDTIVTCLF
ncbi:MAG: FIST C-terminal domain-containing protein [Endomicrobium sp.]|jgi:hypothetical protein|nr:FIST C-terminal domain-containing protein [Endomicrobium sp.]